MHNQYYWTPSETLKKGWSVRVDSVAVIIYFFPVKVIRKASEVELNQTVGFFFFFHLLKLLSYNICRVFCISSYLFMAHIVFCNIVCIFKDISLTSLESWACLRKLNFATSCMVFNTLLNLIVSTGEWPRFPCGRIAFGCLQLSGNCFSRLGYHPLLSGVWARPRTEPWGTPCFLWAHTANTRTRHTHQSHAKLCPWTSPGSNLVS